MPIILQDAVHIAFPARTPIVPAAPLDPVPLAEERPVCVAAVRPVVLVYQGEATLVGTDIALWLSAVTTRSRANPK